MRSYCLYNEKYLDIADIYEVIDGKQINIPEKLKEYRKLSDTHRDLKCPCGCGEIVVLVAGSVRRQHFRLLKRFENTNCKYEEENELSIKSKIALKCWMSKNLPQVRNEVTYRVPINELTDNNRRYEISIYSRDYNFGIVYYRLSSNIVDEKIKLQTEYLETKILYVTAAENEYNDDQYPEHLMKIQERQGYCFYLDMEPDMLYQEIRAKVCIYIQNYKRYWKSVPVCEGRLDQYEIDRKDNILFDGKKLIDLVQETKNKYQKEQEDILEQIRIEKEREAKEELERQEQIRKVNEEREQRLQEEREQQEERKRKRDIEIAQENAKRQKEEKARKAQKQKKFLSEYPKFAVVYNLLSNMKFIKGVFVSDQSDGTRKNNNIELVIQSVNIDMDRHRIEVVENNWKKVYFFVLETNATKCYSPRTGVAYTVLDYTRIDDVEHHLETAFICAFKRNYECEAPNIACQFLGEDNKCMCENTCTYQKKTDGR